MGDDPDAHVDMDRRDSSQGLVVDEPEAIPKAFPLGKDEYLFALNVNDIERWTVDQVCEKFLQPLDLDQSCGELFHKHNITGDVLMRLGKRDLKEMKIFHVGERAFLHHCLKGMKDSLEQRQRDTILWEGLIPAGGVSYFSSCGECLKFKLCGCFMEFATYKVQAQGMMVSAKPPKWNCCCQGYENDFKDFRLLKEITWHNQRRCCLQTYEMHLAYADDESNQIEVNRNCCGWGGPTVMKKTILKHPDMTEAQVEKIKEAWRNVRLVAD